MCDRERLRESTGLDKRERVWHRHGDAFVEGCHLRLSATADHGHDPVTDVEALHTWASGGHHACELEARDVSRPARRGRVQTGSLHQVGAVQSGRLHPDQQLPGAGLPGPGRSFTMTEPFSNTTARMG